MDQAAATITTWATLREALARIGPLFVSQQAAEQCIMRGIQAGAVRYRSQWCHPAVAAALGVDVADILKLGAKFNRARNCVILVLQIPTARLPELPTGYPVRPAVQLSGIDFKHAPGFVEVELLADIEVSFEDVGKLSAPDPAQPTVRRLLRALLEDLDRAMAGEEPAALVAPTSRQAGGRPETWDWPGLKARLPDIVRKTPFEDRPALEEWFQSNAMRTDGKPRGDGPSIGTVRRAIRRHRLNEIPGLFRSA